MDASIAQLPDSRRIYTTGQVLEWCDLGPDTLRYWKEALPPIAKRDGRSSGYSFVETVALAAIAQACAQLNLPVSFFTDHAAALFKAVETHFAEPTENFVIIIHDQTVSFGTIAALPDAIVLALVRVDHVIAKVRSRMAPPPVTPSQFSLFDALP